RLCRFDHRRPAGNGLSRQREQRPLERRRMHCGRSDNRRSRRRTRSPAQLWQSCWLLIHLVYSHFCCPFVAVCNSMHSSLMPDNGCFRLTEKTSWCCKLVFMEETSQERSTPLLNLRKMLMARFLISVCL